MKQTFQNNQTFFFLLIVPIYVHQNFLHVSFSISYSPWLILAKAETIERSLTHLAATFWKGKNLPHLFKYSALGIIHLLFNYQHLYLFPPYLYMLLKCSKEILPHCQSEKLLLKTSVAWGVPEYAVVSQSKQLAVGCCQK